MTKCRQYENYNNLIHDLQIEKGRLLLIILSTSRSKTLQNFHPCLIKALSFLKCWCKPSFCQLLEKQVGPHYLWLFILFYSAIYKTYLVDSLICILYPSGILTFNIIILPSYPPFSLNLLREPGTAEWYRITSTIICFLKHLVDGVCLLTER